MRDLLDVFLVLFVFLLSGIIGFSIIYLSPDNLGIISGMIIGSVFGYLGLTRVFNLNRFNLNRGEKNERETNRMGK